MLYCLSNPTLQSLHLNLYDSKNKMGTFSADPDADRHGGHSQRATSLSQ